MDWTIFARSYPARYHSSSTLLTLLPPSPSTTPDVPSSMSARPFVPVAHDTHRDVPKVASTALAHPRPRIRGLSPALQEACSHPIPRSFCASSPHTCIASILIDYSQGCTGPRPANPSHSLFALLGGQWSFLTAASFVLRILQSFWIWRGGADVAGHSPGCILNMGKL